MGGPYFWGAPDQAKTGNSSGQELSRWNYRLIKAVFPERCVQKTISPHPKPLDIDGQWLTDVQLKPSKYNGHSCGEPVLRGQRRPRRHLARGGEALIVCCWSCTCFQVAGPGTKLQVLAPAFKYSCGPCHLLSCCWSWRLFSSCSGS